MRRVLLIEDDPLLCDMVETFLAKKGYEVQAAHDGLSGLAFCQNEEPDLVLLDLMLPKLSGEAFMQALRRTSNVPVIVLSAKIMVQTKIDLLTLGADDSLTKPFDLYELLARIEATLRRVTPPEKIQALTYRDLVIDGDAATAAGKPLVLTAKELAILRLFMEHPGKVFSKQNLYTSIWHEDYALDDSTIHSHLSNLRSKLQTIPSFHCA